GGIASPPVETVARDAKPRRAPPGRKAVEIAAAPLSGGTVQRRRCSRYPVQPLEVAEEAELLRRDERALVRILGRGSRVQVALRIHAAAWQLVEGDFKGLEGRRYAVHRLLRRRIGALCCRVAGVVSESIGCADGKP